MDVVVGAAAEGARRATGDSGPMTTLASCQGAEEIRRHHCRQATLNVPKQSWDFPAASADLAMIRFSGRFR